jgi:hypothetical protein
VKSPIAGIEYSGEDEGGEGAVGGRILADKTENSRRWYRQEEDVNTEKIEMFADRLPEGVWHRGSATARQNDKGKFTGIVRKSN